MIEGARWRKWVFFYVPMALFLLFLLFPFLLIVVVVQLLYIRRVEVH